MAEIIHRNFRRGGRHIPRPSRASAERKHRRDLLLVGAQGLAVVGLMWAATVGISTAVIAYWLPLVTPESWWAR